VGREQALASKLDRHTQIISQRDPVTRVGVSRTPIGTCLWRGPLIDYAPLVVRPPASPAPSADRASVLTRSPRTRLLSTVVPPLFAERG
jgi:hypothetical protein